MPDRDPLFDDDDDRGREAWSETYIPDPDDDPFRRDAIAEEDARALTSLGIIVGLCAVGVSAAFGFWGVEGAWPFTFGLALGCGAAVLNLRVLARASWALFQDGVLAGVLGFGASFALMIGIAFWLSRSHPDWMLGFGIGLALPGLVGIAYAVRETRR